MIQGGLLGSLRADIAAFLLHKDIVAHACRVSRLAQPIARRLKLPEEQVYRIGLAALLHDIGKIAISKTILDKPGPLADEEWDMVRRHPELGRQMLLRAGGAWACLAPLVVAHHERWDGRGYPRGLAKNAIPLEARILAVADAYDAMISPRVYQGQLTSEEARAEIQRCAGHQFDPQVVTAFLHVLDEQGVSTAEEPPARQVHLKERERSARAAAEAHLALLQLILDELLTSVYLMHGQEARLVLANRRQSLSREHPGRLANRYWIFWPPTILVC